MNYPKVLLKTTQVISQGEYANPIRKQTFKDKLIPTLLLAAMRYLRAYKPCSVTPIYVGLKRNFNHLDVTKTTYNGLPSLRISFRTAVQDWPYEITFTRSMDLYTWSLPIKSSGYGFDYEFVVLYKGTLLVLPNRADYNLLETLMNTHQKRTVTFDNVFTLLCSRNPHAKIY